MAHAFIFRQVHVTDFDVRCLIITVFFIVLAGLHLTKVEHHCCKRLLVTRAELFKVFCLCLGKMYACWTWLHQNI